jgi:hypothetical protein
VSMASVPPPPALVVLPESIRSTIVVHYKAPCLPPETWSFWPPGHAQPWWRCPGSSGPTLRASAAPLSQTVLLSPH